MKSENIKALWAYSAMLAAFPVTGAICAVYYHSATMFYVSLIAIPLAALAFPVVLFLMNVLPMLLIRAVVSFVLKTHRFFTRK